MEYSKYSLNVLALFLQYNSYEPINTLGVTVVTNTFVLGNWYLILVCYCFTVYFIGIFSIFVYTVFCYFMGAALICLWWPIWHRNLLNTNINYAKVLLYIPSFYRACSHVKVHIFWKIFSVQAKFSHQSLKGYNPKKRRLA